MRSLKLFKNVVVRMGLVLALGTVSIALINLFFELAIVFSLDSWWMNNIAAALHVTIFIWLWIQLIFTLPANLVPFQTPTLHFLFKLNDKV